MDSAVIKIELWHVMEHKLKSWNSWIWRLCETCKQFFNTPLVQWSCKSL